MAEEDGGADGRDADTGHADVEPDASGEDREGCDAAPDGTGAHPEGGTASGVDAEQPGVGDADADAADTGTADGAGGPEGDADAAAREDAPREKEGAAGAGDTGEDARAAQGASRNEEDGPDSPAANKATAQTPTDAPLRGWQTIAGQRYYFGSNGKPLTGSQTISGKTYLFNERGQLMTGLCYVGNGAVSYFDLNDGHRLTGQQYVHDAWRNFDASTGMSTGLATVKNADATTKTALYDAFDGSMQYGQQYVNGSWHYFDESSGRMYTRDEEIRRVVDIAYSYVGGTEAQAWSFLNEVCADGGNWCEYGPCISSVRHFFKVAGMDKFLADGVVDGWPHTFLDYFAAHGQVSARPKVGSVAFFNFWGSFARDMGLSACHAEIVVEVGDTYYRTIGAIHGGIAVHTYYYDYYNVGFGLPAFFR